LHLLNFIEEFPTVIRFRVVAFNPLLTWNNTSFVTKKPGV
jgi:hypothetical protein